MSDHFGAYVVDAVMWLFIVWVLVLAFGARVRANRRRAARNRAIRRYNAARAVTPPVQHVVVVPAQKKQAS